MNEEECQSNLRMNIKYIKKPALLNLVAVFKWLWGAYETS